MKNSKRALYESIMRNISIEVKKALNESVLSSILNKFFKEHGGIEKYGYDNKSNTLARNYLLGSITDDMIEYSRVFDDYSNGGNKCWVRLREDSAKYNQPIFYIWFLANDGAGIILGLYNGVEGKASIGDVIKNINKRQYSSYNDGAKSYQYHAPASYFGVEDSDDYQSDLNIRKKNGVNLNHSKENADIWRRDLQDYRDRRKKIGLNGSMNKY